MARTVCLFNVETGETMDMRDVSGVDDLEIFAMKFQMMCDNDDPWIVSDTAERNRRAPNRHMASDL